MPLVLHSSDVFAIAKTRHQQMDSGCIFVDEVSAPHMCKSTLFKSYFFWILLSLCLWRTGVPPPRFPLVSFCRCCFVPAVFFRLIASKTALASHERQKGFPLQSLSGGEDSYAVNKNKMLFSP